MRIQLEELVKMTGLVKAQPRRYHVVDNGNIFGPFRTIQDNPSLRSTQHGRQVQQVLIQMMRFSHDGRQGLLDPKDPFGRLGPFQGIPDTNDEPSTGKYFIQKHGSLPNQVPSGLDGCTLRDLRKTDGLEPYNGAMVVVMILVMILCLLWFGCSWWWSNDFDHLLCDTGKIGQRDWKVGPCV